MIEEHLKHLKESGEYSPTTISIASTWLSRFKAFCGDKNPADLRPKDLERWQKELAWTPGPSGRLYSENTVNQAIGAVRRFYRYLLAQGEVKEDPTLTLVTPKATNVTSPKFDFTPSEIRQLLSSPDLETPTGTRDRAVIGVLLETKVSKTTCSNLDRSHLCFDTGALMTRGRKASIHSLSHGLLADLERYLNEARPLLIQQPTQALFLNKKGGRLSGPSIQQLFRRYRRHCGL